MSGVAGGSSPRSTLAARSVETGVRDQKSHSPGSVGGIGGRPRPRSFSTTPAADDRQPNRGAASSSSI